MIREFERYHGVVLARLIHGSSSLISIAPYPSKYNSSYIINRDIGLYIKHSKKRLSPWVFSFLRVHQDEILQMHSQLKATFIVFVCNNDGVVVLRFNELKTILDGKHENIEWVSIKRRPRQMYSISGSDGMLKFKIGENEFPSKIFETSISESRKG